MLLTTTNTIEGKEITQYFGIVSGETIIGANVFKDFFAGIRDIVGIAVDLDYETVGGSGSMLMVTAAGTAVRYQ